MSSLVKNRNKVHIVSAMFWITAINASVGGVCNYDDYTNYDDYYTKING